MRAWLLMFGGMLVWAVHFGGAYGIASVADVVAEDDAPAALWATLGLTAGCLVADGALLLLIARLRRRRSGDEVDGWVLSIAGLGAALSFLAVLWQGLPALIGH